MVRVRAALLVPYQGLIRAGTVSSIQAEGTIPRPDDLMDDNSRMASHGTVLYFAWQQAPSSARPGDTRSNGLGCCGL